MKYLLPLFMAFFIFNAEATEDEFASCIILEEFAELVVDLRNHGMSYRETVELIRQNGAWNEISKAVVDTVYKAPLYSASSSQERQKKQIKDDIYRQCVNALS